MTILHNTAPKMAEIDVEEVLSQLTLEEKSNLLSGTDFWHTAAIPRLGVPALRVSDGPNGIRGTKFFNGVPAASFPCGTGLAATWDEALIKEGGELMGDEAKSKGAHVILGPTANMQRSPLGGRGFESYSEDPVLSGRMAAATINGIQQKGISATIKHFVANDQEHDRQAVDSLVSERALREIYLLPFQIANKLSNPWAYMTAYNKLNGTHVSENKRILQTILRDEWKWDGLIMSDWFGTYSTTEALEAGLDLEMPGPTHWRGRLVNRAIGAKKIHLNVVDDRVRQVLKLVNKVAASGVPENAVETARDTPETAKVLRKVAGDGIVLLKNDKAVLPLSKDKKTAVIGPNAKTAVYCGGGSAQVAPFYAVTPFDGISAKVGDVKYAMGTTTYKNLPLIGEHLQTKDSKKGFSIKMFKQPASAEKREQIDELHILNSNMFLFDYKNPKMDGKLFYADIEGTLIPEEDGEYVFGLTVFGSGKLFLDGKMIVDNATKQTAGGSFFGAGTVEEEGHAVLKAGQKYEVRVEYGSGPTSVLPSTAASDLGAGAVRIGYEKIRNLDEEIEAAVKLASEVDQVIVCAGLSWEWESEGFDRPDMKLPGRLDELIAAVSKANPKTVVVMQTGTPVEMPWLSSVPGLVQAWFGGNEGGNAIADVLFGDVNPSAKLPLSFPEKVEDNPAFLNFRSEGGRVLYGEDIYIGYRFYEKLKRRVLFPFGFGLSYSSFSISDLTVTSDSENVKVRCNVKNTGSIAGAEVVQVYVAQAEPSIGRPVKELKGFTKVHLDAGKSATAEIVIERKYATSFWDERLSSWTEEKGLYNVLVGNSSDNTPLTGVFEVMKTSLWNGL